MVKIDAHIVYCVRVQSVEYLTKHLGLLQFHQFSKRPLSLPRVDAWATTVRASVQFVAKNDTY